MKNYKGIIIGIVLVLIFIAAVFIYGANTDVDIKENECTVSINCSDIPDGEKADFIPGDGVILKDTKVQFAEGENAFDILYEVVKKEKIHIDFSKNTGSNNAYIKGIGNIYEGDFGAMSGWYYLVNGEMPSVSSSEYKVENGDKIEWIYSTDMNKLFE